jgi:two-component system chemotaxis response regulator CheB
MLENKKIVNVLIVDDSTMARMALREIMKDDPTLKVVGEVPDGKQALQYLQDANNPRPHVITMDVMMPEMDGFETTRKIMETDPIPIVIITSSYQLDAVEKTFRAMEAGAVTILEKPGSINGENFQTNAEKLRETVKLMAGVKVVHRWPIKKSIETPLRSVTSSSSTDIRVVVIGASTGGPKAIHEILAALPREFPIPILIVLHIGGDFIDGLIQWLGKSIALPIHLARHEEEISPGSVYLAPDNLHMGLNTGGRIELSRADPDEGLRPSVSYLFRSTVRIYGQHAIGVLLTGMGRDGAAGLKLMRDSGARTIVQDESTSIVFGMPAEAIRLGGAEFILPLKEIPAKILEILGVIPRKTQ